MHLFDEVLRFMTSSQQAEHSTGNEESLDDIHVISSTVKEIMEFISGKPKNEVNVIACDFFVIDFKQEY